MHGREGMVDSKRISSEGKKVRQKKRQHTIRGRKLEKRNKSKGIYMEHGKTYRVKHNGKQKKYIEIEKTYGDKECIRQENFLSKGKRLSKRDNVIKKTYRKSNESEARKET